MRIYFIFTLAAALAGCAGMTKLHGEYNPSGLPSNELATIGEASTFGERFWSQSFYRITGVNDQPPPKYFNGISKIAAGQHVIHWIYYEIVDLGYAQVEELRDSGKLVVDLKPGIKYAIGKREDGDGTVQIWDKETTTIISTTCDTNCQLVKRALFGIDGKNYAPKLRKADP